MADREQIDFASAFSSFDGGQQVAEQGDDLNTKLFQDAMTGATRSDFYPDSSRLTKMFPDAVGKLEIFDPYND